jgi:CubicO group peptidase (beta-lactamase class C family)
MEIRYFLSLVLCFALTSCLKEDLQKQPFSTYAPISLNDNWQISTPSNEKINEQALADVYKEIQNDPDRYWQVRSMSVFRNGKLVAESYFKDPTDRVNQRPFWSCTKQVLGVLVGIAIDKGLINSINDPIKKYLPNETQNYPDKQDITIRNLLMMQSGIDFENYGLTSDNAALLQQKPNNILGFVLNKSMKNNPGDVFVYKDSDPQILSAILEKVTGKPTKEWANEVLFSKLGIKNIDWISYKDGATIGAFGILTTPRELAKVAQCVLNNGMFNGQQVVSASWITEMTKRQTEAEDKDFGYMWWSYASQNLYYMSGNGGQFYFLSPTKNLIVSFTAEDKTQGSFRFSTPNARYFTQKIEAICQ